MNESELLRLADLNMVEFWCESSRWVPGAEIVEKKDTVFINAGTDFPASNVVFNVATESNEQPEEFLAKAKAFFRERNKRAFSLMFRGHRDQSLIQYCRDQKVFLVDEDPPGMALDEPVERVQRPPGAELRWVGNAQEVNAFARVAAEAFQDLAMPAEESEKTFSNAGRILSPFMVLAVVYNEGEPASTALAMLSHGIGGIYWVATAKKARRKGLAKYCVSEVSNAAFSMGARKVILQASKFGRHVYPGIGYRTFTTYPWFISSSK